MIRQTPATRNTAFVFNWIFIAGLLLLALNDHCLKWTFGNWFTGKLSDFAGLLIFPMFLLFLFPRLLGISTILTGIFFIFWKLPVSDQLIEVYNKVAIIPVTRTIDYSDLIALSFLPLSEYLIRHIDRYRISGTPRTYLTYLIAIPAVIVFMATSPPLSFYMPPGGDIHIGKHYHLKITKEQALAKLREQGFTIQKDTSHYDFSMDRADYYVMKNAVLAGGKDTIETLQFGFMGYKTGSLLLINNVKLKKSISPEGLKELKGYYRKLIRSEIVSEVK